MERDKFKNFIQENKEDFDMLEPKESTWTGIDEELAEKKRGFNSTTFLRIAASIFLILGAAWMGLQINNSINSPVATVEVETPEKADILTELAFTGLSDELEEVERYYVSEVSFKESQLSEYTVDKELFEEIELLKEEFEELKVEMGQSADPMKVVEAMINNYQLRLEILQEILDQIEKDRMKEMQKEGNDESFV